MIINKPLNLNLGAGGHDTQKEGYLSVDLYASADIVHDVSKPFPYPDNTVDNLYASHIIEHLTRDQWKTALPEWFRILKIGGILEIVCPDLEACMRGFINEPERRDWWIKTIYGSQSGPGQYHFNGFTLPELNTDLLKCGFVIIKTETLPLEQLHVIGRKPKLKKS